MVRKPKRERKASTPPPPRGTSDRDKAVDALMALLAEHGFEDIGLAEVAGRAGLKLSQLRAEFGSTLAIYAAHVKDIDRAVLAGGEDMTDEPPRERLFDVEVRRLEAMAPYKEAVRSMLRSARRDPPLALALNALAVRSQRWMLEATGINAAGPHGAVRAQGAALLFARVVGVWLGMTGIVRDGPHHGGARPRARRRGALGWLRRRPHVHPEMHPARAAAPAPPSPPRRRGAGGGLSYFRLHRHPHRRP